MSGQQAEVRNYPDTPAPEGAVECWDRHHHRAGDLCPEYPCWSEEHRKQVAAMLERAEQDRLIVLRLKGGE